MQTATLPQMCKSVQSQSFGSSCQKLPHNAQPEYRTKRRAVRENKAPASCRMDNLVIEQPGEGSIEPVGRRTILQSVSLFGSAAAALWALPESSASAENWGARDLSELMTSRVVTNPGNAFSGPSQLYFPDWFEGEWHATSTFAAFDAPLGRRFVPKGALEAVNAPVEYGGLGSVVEYDLRFYAPPDNELGPPTAFGFANGKPPRNKVVADRKFNTRATTNAFMGFGAVQRVEYDPVTSPTKLVVQLAELTPDMQPIGQKRVELYINNRSAQIVDDHTFLCSEFYRQVGVGVRRVDMTDYELLTKYVRRPDGSIHASQRSVVYLQPQDDLFFDVYNRGVAVYEYEIDLAKRVLDPQALLDLNEVYCQKASMRGCV
eukprot:CAMPEP_0198231456 /NCGR_PEP_ID=MMETSP1445-20131203/115211_1 /TAXON_ID=36898 /ORGANISM="Pyramimonas sp., Strain CCMP2087" /LENGTH=374 /DNA_ID=CAMNT_0043912071 /DNA_START=94 /DNA_END=1218 /DNA_ORIENTATION=-